VTIIFEYPRYRTELKKLLLQYFFADAQDFGALKVKSLEYLRRNNDFSFASLGTEH
jgi:hypothetical protein